MISKNYDDISNAYLENQKIYGYKLVYESIIDKLEYAEKKRIIDLGCGPADFISNLKKKFCNTKITGVDISSNFIEIANKKIKEENLIDTNFVLGDITKGTVFSENNELYDYVVSTWVILVLSSSYDKLLGYCKTCYNNLKEGGKAFIYSADSSNDFVEINEFRKNQDLSRTIQQYDIEMPKSKEAFSEYAVYFYSEGRERVATTDYVLYTDIVEKAFLEAGFKRFSCIDKKGDLNKIEREVLYCVEK